jgi:propionate CoA-transferase
MHHPPQHSTIEPGLVFESQVGAFGGIPGGGLKFGTSHNAAALVPTATMIDFYNGGGVDMACLGMAEVSHFLVVA